MKINDGLRSQAKTEFNAWVDKVQGEEHFTEKQVSKLKNKFSELSDKVLCKKDLKQTEGKWSTWLEKKQVKIGLSKENIRHI